MDPDANLREQREIAARIVDMRGREDDPERLAELVEALDEWLSKGGFLPQAWQKDR